MKKFIFGLLAAITLALSFTGCEMTYGEDKYPTLVQYYCCWGDAEKWNDHSDPAKTLMTRDASKGTYSIEVETEKKNQRFEITKGASYTIEYCYYNANTKVYSQDEANRALFPKNMDNGVNGSMHSVLPEPGKYTVTFDPTKETYTIAK